MKMKEQQEEEEKKKKKEKAAQWTTSWVNECKWDCATMFHSVASNIRPVNTSDEASQFFSNCRGFAEDWNRVIFLVVLTWWFFRTGVRCSGGGDWNLCKEENETMTIKKKHAQCHSFLFAWAFLFQVNSRSTAQWNLFKKRKYWAMIY